MTTHRVGYRIELLLGVSVIGNTYGSATYGAGIYGTQASDDVNSFRYRVIPLIPPGGASSMDDPDLTVVRGDSLPTLTVQIIGDDDKGLNLTGTQVFFHSRAIDSGRDAWRSGGCTIVDAANGIVNYDWTDADTFLAGEYLGEFEVVYASGRRLTIPTIGKLRLHIPDDIFDSHVGDPSKPPPIAHYRYAGATLGDPGSGGIKVAVGSPSQATLSVHIVDADGIDRRNGLLALAAGDDVVVSVANAEVVRYQVTDVPIDAAVYFQVPARLVTAQSSWPPAVNTVLTIAIEPAYVPA